jgi:hypothetical protein
VSLLVLLVGIGEILTVVRAALGGRGPAATVKIHRLTSVTHHSETVIRPGLEYRPGDPVAVRVVRRERRTAVTDDGRALQMVRPAPGWRTRAQRIARDLDVNVSRQGTVSLPVVAVGPGLEAIVQRIAGASLTLYQELLELEAVAST